MTKSNDLRVQIEEARTKLFRWMGVAFVAAAVSGAMGEGFPNTIQDYIVDVSLIISIGMFTRYAVRLNRLKAKLVRERRRLLGVL